MIIGIDALSKLVFITSEGCMAEASESWVSARGVRDSASIMELTSGAHKQVFLDLFSPCQLLIVRRDCNALLLCHFEALIPLALL